MTKKTHRGYYVFPDLQTFLQSKLQYRCHNSEVLYWTESDSGGRVENRLDKNGRTRGLSSFLRLHVRRGPPPFIFLVSLLS